MGTGAMVARASDLPYLIVGVVLGSIVLIIVTFIPFCLWRAWSKQSESHTSARTDGKELGEGEGSVSPTCRQVPRQGQTAQLHLPDSSSYQVTPEVPQKQ